MTKFSFEELRPIRDDERKLLISYPLFFRAAHYHDSYRCPLGAYGLECGSGWFPILDEMASRIEVELKAMLAAVRVEEYLPMLDRCLQGIRSSVDSGQMDEAGNADSDLPLISYCCQVKEKLGGLLVYVQRGRLCDKDAGARIRAAIEDARLKAEVTCENCGQPGVLRKAGWLRVSCSSCEKTYKQP